MQATESGGSLVARLLPDADERTVRHLEQAARRQGFARRYVLHARGLQLPPFVVLDGHVMYRRIVETGDVRAAPIAGPGWFGGLRSISAPDADAVYELVALTDGTWATWDPGLLRELALRDGGLAVGLLDRAAEFAVVLNDRLDERSFSSTRQRMAAILLRYGEAIFDTSRPVAQRPDLAALIGTSRVMMYRTLGGLEADGLVKREKGGGIKVLDKDGLARLVDVGRPDAAS
jgi:CRP-like cAMP-binding protein